MKHPQLNLRDLFWLIVVVAMGLGWWVERTRLQSSLDVTTAALAAAHTDFVGIFEAVAAKTKEPVLSIKMIQPDEFEVMTGVVRGPLNGGGSVYAVQKRDGKWQVTESSYWAS